MGDYCSQLIGIWRYDAVTQVTPHLPQLSVMNLPIKPKFAKHPHFLYTGRVMLFTDLGFKCAV
jgi:hypothetical protein